MVDLGAASPWEQETQLSRAYCPFMGAGSLGMWGQAKCGLDPRLRSKRLVLTLELSR